ncbi:hypothetical protein CHLNCDRAFT_57532 [Chlorella variabilis]|uniref:Serpin domain-containing protein n=1 Tax=Chlorella variabilis TaxID=554065 RepID=E1ZBF8_CHLVA|nr:hypothetical protein CHLNCDRAFT_57532 [Chlorella variabilis]EFN56846.1 hypothetical protein CHLNCDRAFT_57532 [Chlorella variabilis]|eukprot:XP_005848948.1 hypothetical protein CHLNCDRAFT_57532 [Chlorella variabilis]
MAPRCSRPASPLVGLLLLQLLAPTIPYAACRELRTLLQLEAVVPPAEAELAAAVNIFGDEIFAQLSNETKPGGDPGLIISPYSIAQALAMLLNGADPNGTSYQQLEALFGANQVPLADLNQEFQALTAALLSSSQPDSGIRIDNANSAWLKEGLRWQQQYSDSLEQYYNATLGTLTTAQASSSHWWLFMQWQLAVNSWVAEATNNKITQIVTDDIVADAILILANAIYFKGSWVKSFPEELTKATPFHLLDGSTMQAAMMYQPLEERAVQVATLPAAVGNVAIKCQAIQLLFAGFEYAGVAAQPVGAVRKVAGAQLELETAEGPVDYAEALAACRSAVVDSLPGGFDSKAWDYSTSPINLYLPRFEIEFFASLNTALQALGVTQPFEGGDLTQMAEDAEGNPVQGLAVTEVLHKVYEKVDEKGAEAAAVTAIAVTTSAPVQTNPPVDLRFDRPFLFSIVHCPSGLALFNGQIYKPEEWGA